MNSNVKVKEEKVDEQLDSSSSVDSLGDDEEDEIQRQLLAENPDFDISDDEEEAEQENVTMNEITSSGNIKVEKTDEDIVKNDDHDFEEDDLDLQNQLLMDQDFSDSDEDSDDEQTEIVPNFHGNKFFQDLLKEADSTKYTLEEHTGENSQRDELHQQKLREVENLLIKEDGFWKCKICQKQFQKKSSYIINLTIITTLLKDS